ncbi:hypothetical protein C7B76_14525 [filamentous cyanobacterium CCP2]|jgi:hypothetical protein|nr:hypothetical protein C7B76_14525 [filamentous cyanobacterium CCP2]
MKHYCYNWIQDWCEENGWSDPFLRERREYWAFPPNAVMPLPIPSQALRLIKSRKGLSPDEQKWCIGAIGFTLVASLSSYLLHSPMPLVAAFAFCAMVAAQMEVED